ncbi:MAG: dihydropteroate synthase [Thermoproteus sp. AZ2]|uniref:Dihydropteroate synthase n=1 Tax=Thermoproteus sp. AZ2 TaxID=1609232 RepID=A0ACC6UZU4_9CREN
MSTAPYKETWVPAEVELERVVPVIKALAEAAEAPISVDTFRPKVAEAALKAGASIINDVTGLKLYPELCRIAADYGASLVLMARERSTRPGVDPVQRVLDALRESLEMAENCGVDPRRIVVDPGIGFPLLPPRDEPHLVKGDDRHGDPAWPFWRWDLRVLGGLRELRALGKPILVGVSRKTFIRRLLDLNDPEAVVPGSIAAEAVAVLLGAHAVRTHNPPETWQAVKIAESIRPYV